jgi:hypothetical protein
VFNAASRASLEFLYELIRNAFCLFVNAVGVAQKTREAAAAEKAPRRLALRLAASAD